MTSRPIAPAVAALLFVCAAPGRAPCQETTYRPKIAAASDEGEKAIGSFRHAEGFDVTLFAAEPDVANPVTIWIDERGRCFVGESYRQETKGVPDNRAHSYWRLDDLQSQTVDDRGRMYLKHHPEYAEEWTVEHDLVRLLEDRDGDGRADRATIFADGFNDLLDGTGAGLLLEGEDLFYTCIPHLWRLRDRDGDGIADERTALHRGFGVRVALRGHDLHGLVLGPDGKLYFSVGDRGYNVKTPEGRHLVNPGSGAVFRCELDGSELEVFATGLRNPQELAFDDHGNLFTGDNNCDAGDSARIVYVVEGGDCGWRMNYQYPAGSGPWMSEGWWKTRFEGQAAFLNPPLAHLTSGPSGLTYDTGVGLPAKYRRHFFLCDFRGSRTQSGILAFRLRPAGAGFELAESEEFLWGVLATDVDFGPAGNLWVSDWVAGWVGEGKGRIYRVRHPETLRTDDALVRATAELFTKDLSGIDQEELARLLRHLDRRIRRKAQFELAARGPRARATLVAAARECTLPASLHAIWALGRLARKEGEALDPLIALLADVTVLPEVRAQCAKVLGEARRVDGFTAMLAALKDDSARVRYFAAMALGKLGDHRAIEPVLAMLRENADADLYLRHAGVMALTWIGAVDRLLAHSGDPSDAVRMGILLALRRLADPRIARFLHDDAPWVVAEAARAIYDVPIPAALPELAESLIVSKVAAPAFLRRAVGANDLLSEARHAENLARHAAEANAPEESRVHALAVLRTWSKPPRIETVHHLYHPRPARTGEDAVRAIDARLGSLFEDAPGDVRRLAADIAARFRLQTALPYLRAQVDAATSAPARIAALRALATLEDERLPESISKALADEDAKMRARGAALLAKIDPGEAVKLLSGKLETGSVAEKQLGVETLARMRDEAADAVLVTWLEKLVRGRAPGEVVLELLDAAEVRAQAGVEAFQQLRDRYRASLSEEDPLAEFLACLAGGDVQRGRTVFLERPEAGCLRCHAIGERTPTDRTVLAGPDLTDVGTQRDRRYLLHSMIDPNATITAGFEAVIIETAGGDELSGRVVAENEGELTLETVVAGQVEVVTVPKNEITYRNKDISGMPTNLSQLLTPHDLRDLVEFLTSLRRE